MIYYLTFQKVFFLKQQAVLDGYGWYLKDQTSRLSNVSKFLRKVPEYQVTNQICLTVISSSHRVFNWKRNSEFSNKVIFNAATNMRNLYKKNMKIPSPPLFTLQYTQVHVYFLMAEAKGLLL